MDQTHRCCRCWLNSDTATTFEKRGAVPITKIHENLQLLNSNWHHEKRAQPRSQHHWVPPRLQNQPIEIKWQSITSKELNPDLIAAGLLFFWGITWWCIMMTCGYFAHGSLALNVLESLQLVWFVLARFWSPCVGNLSLSLVTLDRFTI